jgi:hypothetical protein
VHACPGYGLSTGVLGLLAGLLLAGSLSVSPSPSIIYWRRDCQSRVTHRRRVKPDCRAAAHPEVRLNVRIDKELRRRQSRESGRQQCFDGVGVRRRGRPVPIAALWDRTKS